MGIHTIFKRLSELAPEAIKNKKIGDYAGKIIAIDMSIFIYQWYSAGLQYKILGSTGSQINHLQGLLYFVITLLQVNIVPIFVFDGKPPEQKDETLARRRAARMAAIEQGKHAVKVPGSAFNECIELLTIMGVPVVLAPGEAEVTCAHLVKTGVAHLVASEDSDVLMYGVSLVRGLNTRDNVTEYVFNDIIKKLNMSSDQFRDYCIYLGTDYTKPLLPPKKALLAAQHSIAHAVHGHKQGAKNDHNNLQAKINEITENLNEVRGILIEAEEDFKAAGINVNVNVIPRWSAEHRDAINKYLVTKGLDTKRVNTALSKWAAK